MDGSAVFTADIEDWYHALYPPGAWGGCDDARVVRLTGVLLQMCADAQVRGQYYVLGDVALHHPELVSAIRHAGHTIGSHGMWHRHHEHEGDLSDRVARRVITGAIEGYRSPYWDTTPRPNYVCGFFFRAFPIWWVVREVRRTGTFALHPHDLDPDPPRVRGIGMGHLAIRRRLGTSQAQEKLWRILKMVRWRTPS